MTQLNRIMHRNGLIQTSAFQEKWIPYEEFYFSAYKIESKSDFIFSTENTRTDNLCN